MIKQPVVYFAKTYMPAAQFFQEDNYFEKIIIYEARHLPFPYLLHIYFLGLPPSYSNQASVQADYNWSFTEKCTLHTDLFPGPDTQCLQAPSHLLASIYLNQPAFLARTQKSQRLLFSINLFSLDIQTFIEHL